MVTNRATPARETGALHECARRMVPQEPWPARG